MPPTDSPDGESEVQKGYVSGFQSDGQAAVGEVFGPMPQDGARWIKITFEIHFVSTRYSFRLFSFC